VSDTLNGKVYVSWQPDGYHLRVRRARGVFETLAVFEAHTAASLAAAESAMFAEFAATQDIDTADLVTP